MVQILRTTLLPMLGVLCVVTSIDAAAGPEPVQQASKGKAPVSQSAPVISAIESTAQGYIVRGTGFGSDARAVVVNEGNKPVSPKLVRSVSDTKIEVLSKPVDRVQISVQVGRTTSRPVVFVYSAKQSRAGQTSKSRPETSGAQQATTSRQRTSGDQRTSKSRPGTQDDQMNSTKRKEEPQGQSPTQDQRGRGVPASNPNGGRVTDPEGRSVPVGSQNQMIAITSFSAVPDLASGKRQVRLEFRTEYANATHYRAVQIDHSNRDVPFAGIPWQSYRGGGGGASP